MCNILNFMFRRMPPCLILLIYIGLSVPSKSQSGSRNTIEQCLSVPRSTQLTFGNYQQIINNSTDDFRLKHLVTTCDQKTRKALLKKCEGKLGQRRRHVIQATERDAFYQNVYNACSPWAQTRMNEIKRNGGFKIGKFGKFSNRTSLIVDNTTLIHIEQGIQGLLFTIEKKTCWKKHLRYDNGKIHHYKNCR